MGQFSWLYADTKNQMLDCVEHNSYLLIPKEFEEEFGSFHIAESCYDGYGMFGKYDVYELIAYWNKQFIYDNPRFEFSHYKGKMLKDKEYYDVFCRACEYKDFETFKRFLEQYGIVLRYIGIDIACFDEDNRAIRYPIKIVEDNELHYRDVEESPMDPNQGWEMD